jgi:hypothetical protein
MASNNDKTVKDGGDRLRERYYRIKNSLKISPELDEATREKGHVEKTDKGSEPEIKKKIASPRPEKDADL